MNARVKRVSRLVDLAEKALESARAKLAESQRAVSHAEAEAARHEEAWSVGATSFAEGVTDAGELALQAAHLRMLRIGADQAGKRLERARSEQKARSEQLLEAARDRRKLDLWRDRMIEAESEIEKRIERHSSDDLAARVTRERS